MYIFQILQIFSKFLKEKSKKPTNVNQNLGFGMLFYHEVSQFLTYQAPISNFLLKSFFINV